MKRPSMRRRRMLEHAFGNAAHEDGLRFFERRLGFGFITCGNGGFDGFDSRTDATDADAVHRSAFDRLAVALFCRFVLCHLWTSRLEVDLVQLLLLPAPSA